MPQLTLLETLKAAREYVVDGVEEAERQVAMYDGYPTLGPRHRATLEDARATLAAMDDAIASLVATERIAPENRTPESPEAP